MINGVALRYGQRMRSRCGSFWVTFRPGVFTRALQASPFIGLCIDHDWYQCAGSTTDGTLTIYDEPDVLGFVIDPFASDYPRKGRIYDRTLRRQFCGVSVGGLVVHESSHEGDLFSVIEASFDEISLCLTMTPRQSHTWVKVA